MACACTQRDAHPEKFSTPLPHQENKQQQNTPETEPKEQLDNTDSLTKSNRESIEENINGFDISEDEAITRQAESLMMTQIHTAVDQKEITQLVEKETESPDNDILLVYDKQLPADFTYAVQYEKYNL